MSSSFFSLTEPQNRSDDETIHLLLIYIQIYLESLNICTYSNSYTIYCKEDSQIYSLIQNLSKQSNAVIPSHTMPYKHNYFHPKTTSLFSSKPIVYNKQLIYPFYILCKKNEENMHCSLLKFFLKFYMFKSKHVYNNKRGIQKHYYCVFLKLETTDTNSVVHLAHATQKHILNIKYKNTCKQMTPVEDRIEDCKIISMIGAVIKDECICNKDKGCINDPSTITVHKSEQMVSDDFIDEISIEYYNTHCRVGDEIFVSSILIDVFFKYVLYNPIFNESNFPDSGSKRSNKRIGSKRMKRRSLSERINIFRTSRSHSKSSPSPSITSSLKNFRNGMENNSSFYEHLYESIYDYTKTNSPNLLYPDIKEFSKLLFAIGQSKRSSVIDDYNNKLLAIQSEKDVIKMTKADDRIVLGGGGGGDKTDFNIDTIDVYKGVFIQNILKILIESIICMKINDDNILNVVLLPEDKINNASYITRIWNSIRENNYYVTNLSIMIDSILTNKNIRYQWGNIEKYQNPDLSITPITRAPSRIYIKPVKKEKKPKLFTRVYDFFTIKQKNTPTRRLTNKHTRKIRYFARQQTLSSKKNSGGSNEKVKLENIIVPE
jgi:hypothetical protein